MAEPSGSRLVQSTLTSLRILEYVHDQQGARLTDVAEALDIGHSTAHNHLVTLHDQEWLVRRDGEFRLGMKFLHFGRSARRRTPYFAVVRRHLTELAGQTNLELEYLIEQYGRLISIINIVPDTGVHGSISENWEGVGNYYFLTNTASGKAILAELPHDRVEAILDRWGLPAQTPYSVTDRETLFEQLERTRERGYAEAQQEFQEGFENIAVAVTEADGAVVGAVSIGWPVYLFDGEVEDEVVELLVETKAAIESDIADSG